MTPDTVSYSPRARESACHFNGRLADRPRCCHQLLPHVNRPVYGTGRPHAVRSRAGSINYLLVLRTEPPEYANPPPHTRAVECRASGATGKDTTPLRGDDATFAAWIFFFLFSLSISSRSSGFPINWFDKFFSDYSVSTWRIAPPRLPTVFFSFGFDWIFLYSWRNVRNVIYMYKYLFFFFVLFFNFSAAVRIIEKNRLYSFDGPWLGLFRRYFDLNTNRTRVHKQYYYWTTILFATDCDAFTVVLEMQTLQSTILIISITL